jgi:hypothetical protein
MNFFGLLDRRNGKPSQDSDNQLTGRTAMKTLIVATGLCLVVPGVLPGAATGTDKPSGVKFEAPLNRAGPQLIVRVVEEPATSNWHYDIHVTTTDGLDQHFAIRNGQAVTETDVRLIDLNGDGFLDILLVGGKDHRGEDWFKTWVFDAKAKKYRWIDDR